MAPKGSPVAAQEPGLAPARRAGAAESVTVLLRNLIDYAGLFPPASLGMAQAVTNYEAYSKSEYRWMLGRFIIPAARLGEFESALRELHESAPGDGLNWRVSALLGADVSADLGRIREFNARGAAYPTGIGALVESVEVKAAGAEEIGRLVEIIPTDLATYFEIPLSADIRDCAALLAACGGRAKIRTGGETADKFPTAQRILEFVEVCSAAGVAFKATAGLHHPLRSKHRLTYQPDSPSGMMHGFLNVFLAAAFVRRGMKSADAAELLNEEYAAAFDFDSEGVNWRTHRLSLREIAGAREGFAVSFGSCSFREPVEDLQALHLL